PYLVAGGASLTVGSGATLTIPAGTVVKFEPGQSRTLEVSSGGTLNAQGTAENLVAFTTFLDDSMGGDSNADGSGSTPQPGDWGYVQLTGSSTPSLSYCRFRYGGRVYGTICDPYCHITSIDRQQLWITGRPYPAVSVTNCTFENVAPGGPALLYQANGEAPTAPQISGNLFRGCAQGISLSGSTQYTAATVSNNVLYMAYQGSHTGIKVAGVSGSSSVAGNTVLNAETGIVVDHGSISTVSGNTVVNAGTGISVVDCSPKVWNNVLKGDVTGRGHTDVAF